jgi:hypothetical protein
MYTNTDYNIHGAIPLLFVSPCWFPFAPLSSPLYLPGTLRAVTGSVHLGLRLLVNWPPLSQSFPQSLPLQHPRTQVTKRLTMTTLRIRLLLSGTVTILCKRLTASLPWVWIKEIKCMMVVNFMHGLFLTWTQKSHCIYKLCITIFTEYTTISIGTNPLH